MEDSIIDSPLVEYTDEEYKYASQFNSREYDLKDNIDASYLRICEVEATVYSQMALPVSI